MVQFKIQSKILKAFMKASADLLNEIRIHFSNGKWSTIHMDGSHISLINQELKKEAFEEYSIEKDLEVGIHLSDNLITFLNNSKDLVSIEVDLTAKMLHLKSELNGLINTFEIPIVSVEYEEIDMDSLNLMEYDNSIEINCAILNQIVTTKKIEGVQFEQLEKELKVNLGTFDSNTNFVKQQSIMINHESNHQSINSYAKPFFDNILTSISSILNKQSKIFKDSIIRFDYKSDCPLKVSISQLENNYTLIYFIAPRVEEDSDSEENEEVKEVKAKIESEKGNLLASIYSREQIVAYLKNEKLHIQVVDNELKSAIYSKKNIIQSNIASITEANNLFAKYYTESDLIDLAKVKFSRLTEKDQLEKEVIQLTIDSDQTLKDLIEISNELSVLER